MIKLFSSPVQDSKQTHYINNSLLFLELVLSRESIYYFTLFLEFMLQYNSTPFHNTSEISAKTSFIKRVIHFIQRIEWEMIEAVEIRQVFFSRTGWLKWV